MVCHAPAEIDNEFRSIIDQMIKHNNTDTSALEGQVTIIAPEIWRRFEELGLEEEIIDEIIDRLKQIPPENRLKYLNTYFDDEKDDDDMI